MPARRCLERWLRRLQPPASSSTPMVTEPDVVQSACRGRPCHLHPSVRPRSATGRVHHGESHRLPATARERTGQPTSSSASVTATSGPRSPSVATTAKYRCLLLPSASGAAAATTSPSASGMRGWWSAAGTCYFLTDEFDKSWPRTDPHLKLKARILLTLLLTCRRCPTEPTQTTEPLTICGRTSGPDSVRKSVTFSTLPYTIRL